MAQVAVFSSLVKTMASEPQGRALLQSVADAILSEQWSDVTTLLQEHAPALERQARVRAQKDAASAAISERANRTIGVTQQDCKASVPRSEAEKMALVLRFATRMRSAAKVVLLVSAIFAVFP
eukprot:gnl/MRDRNA2_/MRDRNA2_349877_c0_seq1.p1 gnl/MRDRNA2_/MRDRNA2_349877_c0~~gnl/MRDRNA2_/MRDRNA2_349877_c0_seq1.p1  ORF type:complete len:123 (-),score=27.36 gnl/MRDRNA2_/MRDRNA2_349877_c0_seq1:3-371(-)